MQPQKLPASPSPSQAPLNRGASATQTRKNSPAAQIKASDRLFLWCLLAAIPITFGISAWVGSFGFHRAAPIIEQQKVMKILVYQPTIKLQPQPQRKLSSPKRVKPIIAPPHFAAKAPAVSHEIKPMRRHANPVRNSVHSMAPAPPRIAPTSSVRQSTVPHPVRAETRANAPIATPVVPPAPKLEQPVLLPPTIRAIPEPPIAAHKTPAAPTPPVGRKESTPEQAAPKPPPKPSLPTAADRDTPELLGSFNDISLPNFDPTELNSPEVKVTWTVDSDGRVHGVKFRPTGNSDVDNAIRSAVQNYKFKPRVINGVAQPARFEHTFDLGG